MRCRHRRVGFIPALLWLMFGIIPAIALAQGREIWFTPPTTSVGSRLNRSVDLAPHCRRFLCAAHEMNPG
jgi:hypothetical protein